MKILLTGKNRSGKTTLLTALLTDANETFGFVTNEVRGEDDRIGFDLVDGQGRTLPLARIDRPTPYSVGRYFVDVENLETFIEPFFYTQPNQLLYIDEIARMQLYSARFKDLVSAYLASENDALCTITQIYDDDFIRSIKQNPSLLICEITPENRDAMKEWLRYAVKNRGLLGSLSRRAQQAVVDMSREYLSDDSYTYLKKLFKNAIPYLADGKVAKDEHGFIVRGNTDTHRVEKAEDGDFSCDCDLFNGRGEFQGQGGLCSHIQAAKLLALQ